MKFRRSALVALLVPCVLVANSSLGAAAAAPGAESASVDPLRLTIAEAITTALSAGTQAQLARSGEARAEVARREALGAILPQVDARLQQYSESVNLQTFGFTIPGFPPVVGPFRVTDAQLTAKMQLVNLAALRGLQSRTVGVRASRLEVEQAENDVALSVARLYLLLARADAQVVSRSADVDLFTTLSRVAGDQLTAGSGTRLDVAQADVQLARARQALLGAQTDRESARIALLEAMGADASREVVPAETLAVPAAREDVATALARARAQRPDLQALAQQERAAELLLAAQRDRRLPSLALEAQGDYSGNHADDLLWTRRIAAVASVPLLRGDLATAIARAKLDLEDARTRRTAGERAAEQEVRTAVLALDNANARAAVAAEGADVAGQALTIARDRREAGYGSPVEVDRAEDAYRQAHEDVIAARADAALAWYALEHATGDIRAMFASGGP